jgi:hypothetical protein
MTIAGWRFAAHVSDGREPPLPRATGVVSDPLGCR